MDYRKIDAALAAALDGVQDPDERALVVFIHTMNAPDPSAATFLKELGVRGIGGQRRVFTATLSPRAIAELSEQPWLRFMRLSQRLRLFEEGG